MKTKEARFSGRETQGKQPVGGRCAPRTEALARVTMATKPVVVSAALKLPEQTRNVDENKGTSQNVVARTADSAVRGSSHANRHEPQTTTAVVCATEK